MATRAADGSVLDTWFPAPELGSFGAAGTFALAADEAPAALAALTGSDADRGTETVVVKVVIADLADKALDAHDVYLRLHLLSHRLIAPHGANMDGVFGLLTNVVWTNFGPCPVEGFETVRARLRRSWLERGAAEAELGWIATAFDPDVLTIGFARRVPTYKRLTLMLRDPERLRALLLDESKPLQLIVAGKSHPADDAGKALIQQVVRFADAPDVRMRRVLHPKIKARQGSLRGRGWWGGLVARHRHGHKARLRGPRLAG